MNLKIKVVLTFDSLMVCNYRRNLKKQCYSYCTAQNKAEDWQIGHGGTWRCMVVHGCKPSTKETEAGRLP